MIVLANGLNVFPEDIEQVLAKQPGISACMVTDLPDRQGRQNIVAILCFPDGMAENERQRRAREAVHNANAVLAPYQRIADVKFWPGDFPRTALLKVLRWKVKARFLEQQPDLQAISNAVAIGNDATSIEQLLAKVCRVDEQSISDGTDLVLDLGFDSLSRVELAGLIEERLGVICDDA
ncbi:MAG: phosphopantetheine-binding protein [Methylomonas sp.]